jgi:outer membrane protein TolC
VLASQSILIFEQSLEVARQQLEEVENRIEVGVIPRNAAAAARAEVARREQALIEARSTRNERRLRLLRLLNVTDNGQLHSTIATTSQPQTTASPLTDLDDRLELALQMRPDLNEAQLRRRQQSLEVVRTRNGLLPKLDLFIDIGKTGYAETFNNAWSNLREDNFDLLSGIRLSSYLGNRTAKAKHFAARASRGQAQAALANLRELVKLDVLLAANEVKRTREQIEASAVTRMLEEQTLKAEQERFSVGDITSLLVAQAQRDLLVSQLAEIEAVVEYRIALVKLCLAEGSLLERRGIGLGNSL